MKGIFILVVVLFAGCRNRKTGCLISAKDILRKYPGQVHIAYQNKGHILGITDNPSKYHGGAYYFNKNGMLEAYRFFQTDSAYNYIEKYDSDGRLIKAIGRPLVDERILEINADSACFSFCLFSLHKIYQNISITTSQNLEVHFLLSEDTICSNIETASFGLNTKGVKEFKIYFSGEYINICGGKDGIIEDSIVLIKDPQLNIAK